MAMMRFRTSRSQIAWFLIAVTQLIGSTVAAEPDGKAAGAGVRESFRFDPDDTWILVPVHLGTQEYRFVVDTGASGPVFDTSLRDHLGPRVATANTTNSQSDTTVELYAPPEIQLGSLRSGSKAPVACIDLSLFRERSGLPVYGIIGVSFVENWIISIDFDEGRLDFLGPGTGPTPEWGRGEPLAYYDGGATYTLVTVGKDMQVPFLIDTGWRTTGGLEEQLLLQLAESGNLQCTGSENGVSIFGEYESRVARLSRLSLGSFEHPNLRLSSGKHNVLGLDYLRRYRVIIDLPHQRLHLSKGKRFDEPDRGPMCGIEPAFKPGGIEVASVNEKSPAYAAGVRAKDVVIELCGKPIADWKPCEINRLFKTEGKEVQMTLERDGKRVEVAFMLKEYD